MFDNVLSQGIAQESIDIGNCLTIKWDRVYLNNVLGLGIPQQSIKSKKCPAMYSDRVYFSKMLGLGKALQRKELGFISVEY